MPPNTEKVSGEDKKDLVENNFTEIRPSLLTELTELPHIWSMYNFSVAILSLVWMHASFSEFVLRGRINLGWRLVFIGFGEFETVFSYWCWLQLMSFTVLPLLNIWAHGIHYLKNTAFYGIWNAVHIILYACFQIALLAAGSFIQTSTKLPFGSSLVILLETLRIVMKVHSLVRSTAPRITKGDCLPTFTNYVYFLYAPTLIYRDSYPRTKQIDWKAIRKCVGEMFLGIIFISCLCESFSVSYFSKIGTPEGATSIPQLIHTLFDTSLAATLVFVYGFYLLIHSWHNMFAEILRFADRQFYQDWWAQDNYKRLYNTINTVVHDWVQTYIYKDLLKTTGLKKLASTVSFLLPPIIYQAVLSLTLGSFLPILFILYIVLGALGTFIDEVRGNLFVWTTLLTGNGILWIFCSLEYYARMNCPVSSETSSISDFLWPKLYTCDNTIIMRS